MNGQGKMHFPYEIVDLTHTLSEDIPSWGGGAGFVVENESDYSDCSFRVQKLKMFAGIGTHIDAPSHCLPGGYNVDDIPIQKLILPCIRIDVSSKMDPEYKVSVQDVLEFEKTFLKISEGCFVLIYTGWSQYWNDPEKYRNTLSFPSVSEEAADLFFQRNIAGLGIDTLSPDVNASQFPVHRILLGAGKYIVENIAQAQLLPPVGSFILIMPLKGKGLTESPCRIFGMIPHFNPH